ncbi:hypothetical protein NMG60_11031034 [Bertholletia excelsa]
MGDPYERVKGGRLTFKGGSLASRSKSIDKKKSKKNKSKEKHYKLSVDEHEQEEPEIATDAGGGKEDGSIATAGGEVYTIDAAKRMKYEQLFPVEAKKFGYDPKSNVRSVEDALDDRVKKKADRYCK